MVPRPPVDGDLDLVLGLDRNSVRKVRRDRLGDLHSDALTVRSKIEVQALALLDGEWVRQERRRVRQSPKHIADHVPLDVLGSSTLAARRYVGRDSLQTLV